MAIRALPDGTFVDDATGNTGASNEEVRGKNDRGLQNNAIPGNEGFYVDPSDPYGHNSSPSGGVDTSPGAMLERQRQMDRETAQNNAGFNAGRTQVPNSFVEGQSGRGEFAQPIRPRTGNILQQAGSLSAGIAGDIHRYTPEGLTTRAIGEATGLRDDPDWKPLFEIAEEGYIPPAQRHLTTPGGDTNVNAALDSGNRNVVQPVADAAGDAWDWLREQGGNLVDQGRDLVNSARPDAPNYRSGLGGGGGAGGSGGVAGSGINSGLSDFAGQDRRAEEAVQYLRDFLAQPEGPSEAEILQTQAADRAMADNLSIARGVRGGAGAQARASRVALAQNAASGVDNAANLGALRAREEQQRRANALQAIDSMGALQGGMDETQRAALTSVLQGDLDLTRLQTDADVRTYIAELQDKYNRDYTLSPGEQLLWAAARAGGDALGGFIDGILGLVGL